MKMKGLYAAFAEFISNVKLPTNVIPPDYEQWKKAMNQRARGYGRNRKATKKGATHRGDIIGVRDNGSFVRRLENPPGTKLARKAAQGRCGL